MRKHARIAFLFVLLLSTLCGNAGTWYVNGSAPAGGDGSYAAPFNYIWDATGAASDYDIIRVAAGVYGGQLHLKQGMKLYAGAGGPSSVFIEGAGLVGSSIIEADGVTDVTISDFTIRWGNSHIGGAITMVDSDVRIENCVFFQNHTDNLYHDNEHGGAIYAQNSTPHIIGCTFDGNGTGVGDGGAIYLENCAGYITGSHFESNSASFGAGGAICASDSTTRIEDCTFVRNLSRNGGGICSSDSDLTVENCVFEGNRVEYDDWPTSYCVGGGMSNIGTEGSTIVRNCRFTENYAMYKGGGLFNGGATPRIENCLFERNTTAFNGFGGGACDSVFDPGGIPPTQSFVNCTFNGNSAGNGGAFYNFGPRSLLVNCTLFGNTLKLFGGEPVPPDKSGGIYNEYAPAGILVLNTIVWGNQGDAQIMTGMAASTTAKYCDIEGGIFPGDHNISDDPLFRDAAAGDFHLSNAWFSATHSPCVDAGCPAADPDFVLLPTHDFEGDIRVRDGNEDHIAVVDIGIDEAPLRRPLAEATIDGPGSIIGPAGSLASAHYVCSLTAADYIAAASGYKCFFGAKNTDLSGITLKGTDAGTLVDKGLAKATASIFQGGAETTLVMTNGTLKLGPGKPFAIAIITVTVKIPDKPTELTLSLVGDGASTIVFENGITLPLDSFAKKITVSPGTAILKQ
jgi:hypothetical protein